MEVSTRSVWELLSELWATAQHVKRATDGQQTDPMLIRLLALVAHHNGARPSEIASGLEVTQPSVSRYVKTLEEAGLVSVAGDPHDGRSYLVRPTDAGRKRLAEFRDALVDRFAEARWMGPVGGVRADPVPGPAQREHGDGARPPATRAAGS